MMNTQVYEQVYILSTVIALGQFDHDDITRSKSLFLNDTSKQILQCLLNTTHKG